MLSGLRKKNVRMTVDHIHVALTVWSEPNARAQTERFDVSGQFVHAARKAFVNGRPVAVFSEAVADALPAVIDLHVARAEIFQIISDPFGVALDFIFVDFLIIHDFRLIKNFLAFR